MKIEIEIGNLSDKGNVRQSNEDYFGAFSGAYGNLIVVSDGMGGHKGGALASRLSVDTIKEHFESLGEEFDEREELKNALEKANNSLITKAEEDNELNDMGATAVILLIRNGEAFTAHLGDSRIYLIRDGNIHQLTKDHSLVQQMIDAGIITKEAAKTHPKKNVITRSLGVNGNSTPDVPEAFTVFNDDFFLLCSDGLTGYVNDEELKTTVLGNGIQKACRMLVDMAKDRGGNDNITVQIVSVKKGSPVPAEEETPGKSNSKNFIFSASIIGAMIAVFAVLMFTGVIDFQKLFKEWLDHKDGLTDTTEVVDTTTVVDTAAAVDSTVVKDSTLNGDEETEVDTLGEVSDLPDNTPSNQPDSVDTENTESPDDTGSVPNAGDTDTGDSDTTPSSGTGNTDVEPDSINQ